jgi:hypothetical protein
MNPWRELQARKRLPARLERDSAVCALQHDWAPPGSVWPLVGQHRVSRPSTRLGERRFECVALTRQDIALGVERIRDIFKLLGAPGQAVDLLSNQQLPTFPSLRFRNRGLPRSLEVLHAPVSSFDRRDLGRHRRGEPRHGPLR